MGSAPLRCSTFRARVQLVADHTWDQRRLLRSGAPASGRLKPGFLTRARQLARAAIRETSRLIFNRRRRYLVLAGATGRPEETLLWNMGGARTSALSA